MSNISEPKKTTNTQVVKKSAKAQRLDTINAALSHDMILDKVNAFLSNNKTKVAQFRTAVQAICFEPNLMNCTPVSIIKSALSGIEVGLSPLKQLGHMYFVPFKNKGVMEAQAQIGYKGWRTLAERAGKIVKDHRVYECDEFDFIVDGFDESFMHKPAFEEHKESDRAWVIKNIKGVLILVKDTTNNEIHHKFVTKDKLFQIKGKSQSVKNKRFSAWDDWEAEMLTAKAMKYVLSKMPMDENLAKAIEIDNQVDIENAIETKTIEEKDSKFYSTQYLKDEPESQELPSDQQPENQTQDQGE